MKKLIFALAVITVLSVPGAAFAGGGEGKSCGSCSLEFKPSPWTTQTTWGDKAVHKLQFGFKNFFGGWTEIFTEPKEAHDAKTCVLKGIGRGLFNGIVDTVGGVLHIATFPITQLDVPLPEGGTSIGS